MILSLRFIFKPFIIYVGYSQNIHTWVLPENLDWFPLIFRTITTIIPDSSTRLKYKTASLLSHVLKSWLECLLHENDEVKILQRDPLEWLECNFIRPSVPSLSLSLSLSLLLLPHFYDCHMIPSSHQMIFALGPILAIMAEKLPTPSIGCATLPHSYWPESSALGNAADSVFTWVPNPGWVPGFLEKNGLGF